MGRLDLRYRSSLGAPTSLAPAEPFTTTITLRPQDWPVLAGHHLSPGAGRQAVWGVPDPVIGQQTVISSVRATCPLAGLEPAFSG